MGDRAPAMLDSESLRMRHSKYGMQNTINIVNEEKLSDAHALHG
jgi:hypothetical protein